MKTQFIAIGLVAAALTSAVAFAEDTQTNNSAMSAQSSAMSPNAPAAKSDNKTDNTLNSTSEPMTMDSSTGQMQIQSESGTGH